MPPATKKAILLKPVKASWEKDAMKATKAVKTSSTILLEAEAAQYEIDTILKTSLKNHLYMTLKPRRLLKKCTPCPRHRISIEEKATQWMDSLSDATLKGKIRIMINEMQEAREKAIEKARKKKAIEKALEEQGESRRPTQCGIM